MTRIVLDDTCGVIGHVPAWTVPQLRRLDGTETVDHACHAAKLSMSERQDLLSTLRRLTLTGLLRFD